MEEKFQFRSVFNAKVVQELAESIQQNYQAFDKKGFCDTINTKLEELNYGARASLIRDSLKAFLPDDFPKAVEILLQSLMPEIEQDELAGFDRFIVLPQCGFVSKYGLEHYDISMHALYEMTKRFTAEGDIRIFIEKFPEKTLKILEKWATDPNCHVRRLVSEGTRPRLPLGTRLKSFQKDPKPVLALLEKLKEDPILYVRRSVANNLNDIAKDNPDTVVATLESWKKIDNEGTQWLIKHALRTLLKQGHKGALELLGYPTEAQIEISSLQLASSQIHLGEDLVFEFDINSKANNSQDLMIDFVIYFMKANGKTAPKVFKLSKKQLQAQEILHIQKKFPIKPISTRKYYAGEHFLALKINGKEYPKERFFLSV